MERNMNLPTSTLLHEAHNVLTGREFDDIPIGGNTNMQQRYENITPTMGADGGACQFNTMQGIHHDHYYHQHQALQQQQNDSITEFINSTIPAIKELEKLQSKNEHSVHVYRCYCCYAFFPPNKAYAPTQVINEFFREIDNKWGRVWDHIRCSCCWMKKMKRNQM